MEHPPTSPPLPADYYRRHAARVSKLAEEATTAAIKEHLREVAREYERLAERADNTTPDNGDKRS
jgi:histone H3/H4